jgi:hypothetical protein
VPHIIVGLLSKRMVTSSALVLLLFFKFSSLHPENIWIIAIVMFLMKLSDTVFQCHVGEIRIDTSTNKLIFKLSSLLSGNEEKIFDLDQVQVIASKNFRLNKWLTDRRL